MRILIAGGFGFIGSKLAVVLAQAGNEVILGSRHLRKPPYWLPNARVGIISWNDKFALDQICSDIDLIIHCAGMNACECSANPVEALAFNGFATARFIEAAARMRVSKFIYLSTAHVYASPLIGLITEESTPLNFHPYATSHLAGENSVLEVANRGKIQAIVLRLSNIFGVPIYKDVNCWMLLVNELCKQAVLTGKLILKTSGLQQRNFMSLTDASMLIQYLATNYDQTDKANIFNVGDKASQSVLEMALLIQQRCISILGYKPCLDISKEGKGQSYQPLNYSVNKIKSIGVDYKNSHKINEIDELLLFCRNSFG